MTASLRQGDAGPDVLAGGPDHDAGRRAALWAALPPGSGVPPGACRPCLAGARAQREALVQVIADGGGGRATSAGDYGPRLCGGHLRDAVTMDRRRAPALLARQAAGKAGALAGPVARRPGAGPGGWLRRSRTSAAIACPACRDGQRAAQLEQRQRSGRMP
ncbi:MAG: hypothetical protein LBI49_13015, partial [Nocardiopsaceae bacterium]|nr:hypothetical protein [Nocardiopsaceae bacterium]